MSEGHTDLNSDNNLRFYNENDHSNGNNTDIYNNDKYDYSSELGQIIRISAFVCLLLKEFQISLWLPSHIEGEEIYFFVGLSE